jgi:hypothetical protein
MGTHRFIGAVHGMLKTLRARSAKDRGRESAQGSAPAQRSCSIAVPVITCPQAFDRA